ncbi:GIY-YIG nuclease family protein [Rhodoferax sp. 4810]|uniref:GIY-YIG nuclease family protein n=1 Tax=Thiospirillum jenense TaxID=1653858 RepID=A0A839HCW2_9GAMM|nr:GIY-YIG nuclease family protein [Rhodoferax jenense]MBB1125246.1 GIY-YIG nuclease family protein [Thiospirillum jenense]
MSNQIIPFFFPESESIQREVRVIMRDGEPWFVAADVCLILSISNHRDAVGKLDDDEKRPCSMQTSRGAQNMTVINESGLYALIMRCRNAKFNAIKKQILEQVLDSKAILKALNNFEVPDDLPDMYVYAIRERETGHVKLGISRNPQQRLRQLQTGNSSTLELVAYRKAENRFADERALHADADVYRLRGEWFDDRALKLFNCAHAETWKQST